MKDGGDITPFIQMFSDIIPAKLIILPYHYIFINNYGILHYYIFFTSL